MQNNLVLGLTIIAIVLTLVIPLQSFSVLQTDIKNNTQLEKDAKIKTVPLKRPGDILSFTLCDSVFSPKVPFSKSIYVFEGILNYGLESKNNLLNNYDKKDAIILISNLDNFKNVNDTKVKGSVWIDGKNTSKSSSFTLTDTYLKCVSSLSLEKQNGDPLKLPLSNSCPIKDIYIKGSTNSKISEKEVTLPSKTFKLQIHAQAQFDPNGMKPKIWGFIDVGDNFISMTDLKIDSACIAK
jgi:hypothetical protein